MYLLFIFSISNLHAQTGNNTVKGKISFSDKAEKIFVRGTAYETDNTPVSKKKRLIDDLNNPRKNVYVSLHPIGFEVSLKVVDAQITQQEQTFLPNVIAITSGSTVYFLNEDEFFHNIYSLTPRARFNIGRRPPGNVYGKKIDKVGLVKLGCDIHPEMGATIISYDTPFFTKINDDGSFQISGLPDGQYEIRAFHPSLDAYTGKVTCKGSTTITHNLKL